MCELGGRSEELNLFYCLLPIAYCLCLDVLFQKKDFLSREKVEIISGEAAKLLNTKYTNEAKKTKAF